MPRAAPAPSTLSAVVVGLLVERRAKRHAYKSSSAVNAAIDAPGLDTAFIDAELDETDHRPTTEQLNETITRYSRAAIADSRLLHLIKGITESARHASDVAASNLGAAEAMTPSAKSTTRLLVSNASAALQQALDNLVRRQLFVDLESGRYVSIPLEREVGQCLRSILLHNDGVVELGQGSEQHRGSVELWLAFDETILDLVVREALGNCRKYRYPGSLIHIAASYHAAESKLCVSVENENQRGAHRLTPEECIQVMSSGVRGANATADSSGLGLDTARKAATAAGGTVWLATREEAAAAGVSPSARIYTALHLELPATLPDPKSSRSDSDESNGSSLQGSGATAPEAEETFTSSEQSAYVSPDESSDLSGLRVLIADDVPMNRLILRHSLTNRFPACYFCEASTGEELLELVAQEADPERPVGFDIFFIDEDMGDGISGSAAVSRLSEMRMAAGAAARAVLFIVVTAGADDPGEAQRMFAAGADLVWGKELPSAPQMLQEVRGVRKKLLREGE